MEMHAFHSRSKSETPRKFILTTPDGKDTEEFLLVRGFYSEQMKEARAAFRERVVENAQSKTPEKGFSEKYRYQVIAQGVEGWSFDEPFSTEAATAFLKECPHIVEDLDAFMYDRKVFFGGEE